MQEIFQQIRTQLENSNLVRERLKEIVQQLDDETRQMQAALQAVHSGSAEAEKIAVHKAKEHLPRVISSYGQLSAIMKEHPGEYYRYNDIWRYQNNTIVFLMVFMHWLETSELLLKSDIEVALQLNVGEWTLELEEYLSGLCSVSNELPRYVVNRVAAGDYECAERSAEMLRELGAAFRLLNLRNDFLRKRFDGLKYDLKRVEEVLYDVKIRGLLKAKQEQPSVPTEMEA